MKTVNLLFVIIILLGACSTPEKTTKATSASPTVTREDVLRGGTSFSNAVVLMVETESLGLSEEYKWLSNNYPGYGLIRRSQVKNSARHYDIVRIKTSQGHVKDIYFDSTRFREKPGR